MVVLVRNDWHRTGNFLSHALFDLSLTTLITCVHGFETFVKLKRFFPGVPCLPAFSESPELIIPPRLFTPVLILIPKPSSIYQSCFWTRLVCSGFIFCSLFFFCDHLLLLFSTLPDFHAVFLLSSSLPPHKKHTCGVCIELLYQSIPTYVAKSCIKCESKIFFSWLRCCTDASQLIDYDKYPHKSSA